jgi:DNA polymerase elongation subunit (family B)
MAIFKSGKDVVRRGTHKVIAADFETTMAAHGLVPEAFCAGAMHEDGNYVVFWDDDAEDYIGPDYDYFRANSAANQLFDYFDTLTEPHVIYFHNGGRFDIQYFAHRLPSQSVVYIGSRAVCVKYGIHEIRDSASIVSVKLRDAGDKGTIDYAVHAKELRDANRVEILDYLKRDCDVLMRALVAFLAVACPIKTSKIPLTISSAAFKQLLRVEGIKMRQLKGEALAICRKWDEIMRPYYVGGHVEAIKLGSISGNFKLYDINSMYPYVMANFDHPIGESFEPVERPLNSEFWVEGFENCPYFLEFEGTVIGLPATIKDETGNFRNDYGQREGLHKFHSHELRVAMEFGLVSISKIIRAWIPKKIQRFDKYVNLYYGKRLELAAKLANKEISKAEFDAQDVTAKLYLNGPYGKFAFDYRNYKAQHYVNYAAGFEAAENYSDGMNRKNEVKTPDGQIICAICETGEMTETYYNVATAASITAAARGVLLRALMTCKNPIYCDTDSILCEDIGNSVPVSSDGKKELGWWKLEAECDRVSVAGRKLYALWKGDKVVKLAAKGYSLVTDKKDIEQMRNAGRLIDAAIAGESTEIKADFMAYKLGKKQTPIKRKLQADKRLDAIRKKLQTAGLENVPLYADELGNSETIFGTAWKGA